MNAEQIADKVLDNHAIQPHWNRTGEQVRALLVEAVKLAQEAPSLLVVSAPAHGVRIGVVERTVTEIHGIISGYLQDGYTLEELIIEGVTQ